MCGECVYQEGTTLTVRPLGCYDSKRCRADPHTVYSPGRPKSGAARVSDGAYRTCLSCAEFNDRVWTLHATTTNIFLTMAGKRNVQKGNDNFVNGSGGTAKSRGKRGVLEKMPDMPLDIVMEVSGQRHGHERWLTVQAICADYEVLDANGPSESHQNQ